MSDSNVCNLSKGWARHHRRGDVMTSMYKSMCGETGLSFGHLEKRKKNKPAGEQAELQTSRLDERFLRAKRSPPTRSLPFFLDLHTEVSRSWARPFRPAFSSPPQTTMVMWWGWTIAVIERCLGGTEPWHCVISKDVQTWLSGGSKSRNKVSCRWTCGRIINVWLTWSGEPKPLRHRLLLQRW